MRNIFSRSGNDRTSELWYNSDTRSYIVLFASHYGSVSQWYHKTTTHDDAYNLMDDFQRVAILPEDAIYDGEFERTTII